MYPRNRKKRTFFSPGTEDRVKKRREDSPDDEDKGESEKVAKESRLNPTKGGAVEKQPAYGSSADIDKEKKGNFDKTNKKNSRREGGKRDRGSDDEDHRALKRKSSKKSSLKQEEDDGKSDEDGDGYGYGEWGSGDDLEEGNEGNESGHESGDDSPANEYHLARDNFNSEESHMYGEGGDVENEESDTGKTRDSSNAGGDNSNNNNNNNNSGSEANVPPSLSSTSTSDASSKDNDSSSNSPHINSSSLSREKSTNGLQSEKYRKKETPPLTKITIAKPKTKPPTVPSPDSLTPEYFKSVLDEMKSEISRLTYRLEETTNNCNARLMEHEGKYVPRAVYTVLEDEVAFLKQQLQAMQGGENLHPHHPHHPHHLHPSQSNAAGDANNHSASSLEKIRHDMVFIRGNLEEVNNDVRQWRMAMDVDLTDKEDRLSQLSLRLDDIERNQQALIIRYPQLMQPQAPQQQQQQQQQQQPGGGGNPQQQQQQSQSSSSSSSSGGHSSSGPDRISSGGGSGWSGSGSGEKISGNSKSVPVNSMQKEREKHSQAQRMMLPPDGPPSKYPPSTAPSSPQPSSASPSGGPFISSFDPSAPSFIQPDGWSQPPMYSRQFASPSGPPSSTYYSSQPGPGPGSGYSKQGGQSNKGPQGPPGHHHHGGPGGHQGSVPVDRDRGRMEYDRVQQERMSDKTNRPWGL